ncbi:hypothetical protein AWENTII_012428 [Aspergillus wentii]
MSPALSAQPSRSLHQIITIFPRNPRRFKKGHTASMPLPVGALLRVSWSFSAPDGITNVGHASRHAFLMARGFRVGKLLLSLSLSLSPLLLSFSPFLFFLSLSLSLFIFSSHSFISLGSAICIFSFILHSLFYQPASLIMTHSRSYFCSLTDSLGPPHSCASIRK